MSLTPAAVCCTRVAIDLPGPRLPHDIGFTRRYAVLHDLPFFHDVNVLRRHNYRVLTFHRDMPTRFGIIPRRGESGDVRWFECEPCYILHVTNCWEEGDWVVTDGCRSLNPMPDAQPGEGKLSSMLAYMRWRRTPIAGALISLPVKCARAIRTTSTPSSTNPIRCSTG
ncbi:MAG: carotenoid oxygenase family protein [Halioglobus sp.]